MLHSSRPKRSEVCGTTSINMMIWRVREVGYTQYTNMYVENSKKQWNKIIIYKEEGGADEMSLQGYMEICFPLLRTPSG